MQHLPTHRSHRHAATKARRAAASSRRNWRRPSATTLERGEQALLFLNRRGFAPLTLCRACGFRLQCPNCDAWLVDHRFKKRLVCHHCGYNTSSRTPVRTATPPKASPLSGRASSDWSRKRTTCFPTSAFSCCRAISSVDGASAPGTRRCRRRALRHRRRHPACRQGPPFPQAQSGRHCRCGSWPRQRRSARRRAHIPIAASGGRPRRPRGRPRRRLCCRRISRIIR